MDKSIKNQAYSGIGNVQGQVSCLSKGKFEEVLRRQVQMKKNICKFSKFTLQVKSA